MRSSIGFLNGKIEAGNKILLELKNCIHYLRSGFFTMARGYPKNPEVLQAAGYPTRKNPTHKMPDPTRPDPETFGFGSGFYMGRVPDWPL